MSFIHWFKALLGKRDTQTILKSTIVWINYSLNTRHCFKHFICIIKFKCPNSINVPFQFYMGGNWSIKKQKQGQVSNPYPLILSQLPGTSSQTTITNSTNSFLKLHLFIFCVCMCVTVHMWRSRNNLLGSVHSILQVLKSQTWVARALQQATFTHCASSCSTNSHWVISLELEPW